MENLIVNETTQIQHDVGVGANITRALDHLYEVKSVTALLQCICSSAAGDFSQAALVGLHTVLEWQTERIEEVELLLNN